MFCKRVHYALILMVTLAQRYGVGGMELQAVAHQHHLPIASFQGVVKRLVESDLIVIKSDETLALKLSPEKITIWQVVECVSRKESLEWCSKHQSQKNRTSTVIMIRKEDEALQDIIRSKLKRYKLSEWSKTASETVYI